MRLALALLTKDPAARVAFLMGDAVPRPRRARRSPMATTTSNACSDFDWETALIDYLEQSGRAEEAQAARWASFERTLSIDRAKAFTKRLLDFEDVEAEQKIFETAAMHAQAGRALELLIGWPALGEAARFITEQGGELRPEPEQAEQWARKLRRRYPAAAERLLRRAAAAAFQRREFITSRRLSEEAHAIGA